MLIECSFLNWDYTKLFYYLINKNRDSNINFVNITVLVFYKKGLINKVSYPSEVE